MMKQRKFAVLAAMILMFSLLLCACSGAQTAAADADQMLDLDYVSTGSDAAEEEQADEPWYAWIKRAFSFGKTDTDETAESKPDSVADLYKKGTENLQKQMEATSEDPEEEHASDEKATTDTGKSQPSRKMTIRRSLMMITRARIIRILRRRTPSSRKNRIRKAIPSH